MVKSLAFIKIVTAFLIFLNMLLIQIPVIDAGRSLKFSELLDFREVIKENKKYTGLPNICDVRIYGGMIASQDDVPYQVIITLKYSWHREWTSLCGGAIVTKRHVITAAHCNDYMSKRRLKSMRVVAGASQSAISIIFGPTLVRTINVTQTWRKIAKWFNHALYRKNSVSNDLAVLVLDRRIQFTDKIYPIRMISESNNLLQESLCVASGFGLMDGRKSSTALQLVCVPIIPMPTCKNIFTGMPISNSTQVCAGFYGKDSCQGESGGLLVCSGVLTGIVTFGGECGTAPGMYTLLSRYTTGKIIPFVRSSSVRVNFSIFEIRLPLLVAYIYIFVEHDVGLWRFCFKCKLC